jgi:hypothetical protein
MAAHGVLASQVAVLKPDARDWPDTRPCLTISKARRKLMAAKAKRCRVPYTVSAQRFDFAAGRDSTGFQNSNCQETDLPFWNRAQAPCEWSGGSSARRMGVAGFLTLDNGTPVRLSSPMTQNSFRGGTNLRPSLTGVSSVLPGGP